MQPGGTGIGDGGDRGPGTGADSGVAGVVMAGCAFEVAGCDLLGCEAAVRDWLLTSDAAMAEAGTTVPGGGTITTYASAKSITSNQTPQAFSGFLCATFLPGLVEGAAAGDGTAARDVDASVFSTGKDRSPKGLAVQRRQHL